MGYTNRTATMKWWYQHTKKIKYCSSEKYDEHNRKNGKVWSPGYELMIYTNTSIPPTLKIELSDNNFVKYFIFEVYVNFPPRGTPICSVIQ